MVSTMILRTFPRRPLEHTLRDPMVWIIKELKKCTPESSSRVCSPPNFPDLKNFHTQTLGEGLGTNRYIYPYHIHRTVVYVATKMVDLYGKCR